MLAYHVVYAHISNSRVHLLVSIYLVSCQEKSTLPLHVTKCSHDYYTYQQEYLHNTPKIVLSLTLFLNTL